MSSTNQNILDQSSVNYYKSFVNFVSIQSKLHADRVFARYPFNNTFKTLTYSEVDRITTNLACEWSEKGKGVDVISYISDNGVDYLLTMIALMKLRSVLLAVSPRNSEAAIVNLLEKTGSKILFTSPKYEAIAKASVANLNGVSIEVLQPFDINALLNQPLNVQHKEIINAEFDDTHLDSPALIIHSSGSTNFPKPIFLSNRYLLNICGIFKLYTEVNPHVDVLNQDDVFLTCIPMCHVFGFFCVFSVLYSGASVVFVEKLPPSQKEIEFTLKQNNCTLMAAPPVILEQMASHLKEGGDFSPAQKLKYIFFAGANLKHETGEWLQKNNINCRNLYGTTEICACLTSNLDPQCKNWYSLHPIWNNSEFNNHYVFEEAEEGYKHLYLRSGSPTMALHVSNREGGGYNTNDLFLEDPTLPGYYNYSGRRDDTLVMENGEKTNPVPMENTIRQSPMVKQVAVLGHARQCTAALVEVDMAYAMSFGPEDIISVVHEAVEDANKECPSHSTIMPQMVKILPFNINLPSTDKGTVIRKKAEAMNIDLVEKLYKDFIEGPTSVSSGDVSSWSGETTESFLVKSTADVLKLSESALSDYNKSVFDLGLNSLTAIQLRNIIAQQFGNVPQNFLFQNSTISSMREALLSNSQVDASELIEKRYQQTQELAKSYVERAEVDFPVAKNDYESTKKDKVVMLTGATGSLGSFMLRDLLKDETVKKVYCLVRGKESTLQDRLVDAFKSRHLDSSLLDTERLEVLPMRLSEPNIGLTKERYDQLKEEVTIVQHCAWLLDFNMAIDHYDKECIAPFYNLLKFAYREANPMHVHIISSVSASAALGPEIEEKPLPFDSHVAMPMGYGQSKFVCEILLNYLMTKKNFPCYIERLGQVAGDTENGVWNTSEQYPLLFIGGCLMQKMPNLPTVIDWIPVDYASAAIVDIMLRTSQLPASEENSIYHIVNPRLENWSDILQAMKSCGLKFDAINSIEWVEALSKDDTNPAFRLMAFYEGSFKKDFKMPVWQTKNTCKFTPVLAKSPIINSDLFEKYLNHWKSVGFYNPSN